jgi:hypothetical protein
MLLPRRVKRRAVRGRRGRCHSEFVWELFDDAGRPRVGHVHDVVVHIVERAHVFIPVLIQPRDDFVRGRR